MFDPVHYLGELAGFGDRKSLIRQRNLCPRLEPPGKHDAFGVGGDVDKPAAACRQIRLLAQFGDVDIARHIHLQKRQEGDVEPAALKIGELLGRGHVGIGVRRAAEGKAGQRHAANRALFNGPGHRLRLASFRQHPWHHGRNAEAKVRHHAALKLHRGTAGDDLLNPVLRNGETVPGPRHLAGNRRILRGFGGLFLIRVQHDQIHQMPLLPPPPLAASSAAVIPGSFQNT